MLKLILLLLAGYSDCRPEPSNGTEATTAMGAAPQQCPEHGSWKNYSNLCPNNCFTLNKTHCFSLRLGPPGCNCDTGYIFEDGTKTACVPINQCEKIVKERESKSMENSTMSLVGITQLDCPENSAYTSCSNPCPFNCATFRHPICFTTICGPPGCRCNEGYIFTDGSETKCIKVEDCPNRGFRRRPLNENGV